MDTGYTVGLQIHSKAFTVCFFQLQITAQDAVKQAISQYVLVSPLGILTAVFISSSTIRITMGGMSHIFWMTERLFLNPKAASELAASGVDVFLHHILLLTFILVIFLLETSMSHTVHYWETCAPGD